MVTLQLPRLVWRVSRHPRYCRGVDDSLDTWFKEEVLRHEAALVRFLTRISPRRYGLTDLCQETYARVYEAATVTRPQFARSFLFSTARNLVFDHIRRERVVSIEVVADIDALNVLIDEISPERRAIGTQQIKLLTEAFNLLPRKCREVMWLRRVQDIPQKEVAKRLRISERTVEKHVSKAVRLLAKYLLARGEADVATRTEWRVSEQDRG